VKSAYIRTFSNDFSMVNASAAPLISAHMEE
jgi:hypothetical protein